MKELLTSRTLRTATAISLSTLALVGCGNNTSESPKASTEPTPAQTAKEQQAQKENRARRIQLIAKTKREIETGLKDYSSKAGRIGYLTQLACKEYLSHSETEFGLTNSEVIPQAAEAYHAIRGGADVAASSGIDDELQALDNRHHSQISEFAPLLNKKCGYPLPDIG